MAPLYKYLMSCLWLGVWIFPSALCWSATTSLLWKLEKPGTPPSYLFGTIHIDDPRVTQLRAKTRTIFDQSEALCLEILPDADIQAQVAKAMLIKKGPSLDELMGDALFSQLSVELAAKGFTPLAVAK